MNKKIIIFVVPQIQSGGTEKHVLKLLKFLSKEKFYTVVICLSSDMDSKNSKIYKDYKKMASEIFFVKPLLNFYLFAYIIFKLKLKRFQIILHSFIYGEYPWDLLIYLFLNPKKLITEKRNLLHWLNPRNKRFRFITFLRNKISKEIIFNSNAVLDAHKNCENINFKKIKIISNGIDLEYMNEKNIKQKGKIIRHNILQSFNKKFIIVCVSNIKKNKGQLDLINALVESKKDLNKSDFYLLFLGQSQDSYKKEINIMIIKKGLQKDVAFYGLKKDVRPFLYAADLGVLCSRAEGFSNALLEYQSCGLASIATNIGGNKEIIKEGFNGYLYNPGDYFDLLSKINLIKSNKQKLLKLSKNSKKIIKGFSKEVMIEKYSEIYSIDQN